MRATVAFFGLLALSVGACKSTTNPSKAPHPCDNSGAAATVSATDDYAFTPDTVTVTVGQAVCFQNLGTLDHFIDGGSGNFGGDLPSGQTLVHTFAFGGNILYRCSRHSNESGTILVKCKPGDISC